MVGAQQLLYIRSSKNNRILESQQFYRVGILMLVLRKIRLNYLPMLNDLFKATQLISLCVQYLNPVRAGHYRWTVQMTAVLHSTLQKTGAKEQNLKVEIH